MAKLPYTIAYKMNPISSFLARKLVSGRFANLINILADREIVKEYLLEDCTVENLTAEVERLLEDEAYRQNQTSQTADILKLLGAQENLTPSQKAADVVLSCIKNKG